MQTKAIAENLACGVCNISSRFCGIKSKTQMKTTLINSKGIAFDAKKGRKVYTIGSGKNKREIDVDSLKDVATKEQFYACESDYEWAMAEQKLKEQEYLAMVKKSCIELSKDGNVNGRIWKDITSFQQSDKQRVPRSFELNILNLRLRILFSTRFEENSWEFDCFASNNYFIKGIVLGKMSAQQAAALAFQKVREYIAKLYKETN
jgi:hypothetical protein